MSSSHQLHRSLRLLLCALVCTAIIAAPLRVRAQAKATPELSVELRAGTLNGRPFAEWTLNELTNVFGRPTAVTSGVGGITGPQLHYHSRGVSFWVQPSEKDSAQRLWLLTLYLSRSWDRSNSAWYDSFRGALLPAVDANWKQSQVLEEFAPLSPVIKTVEDSRREQKAAGLTSLGIRSAETDFVNFTFGKHQVTFAIEPNTKFAERIVLRGQDSVPR